MKRSFVILAALCVFVPSVAKADPVDDLQKVWAAFTAAKSWHGTEAFSNGHTVQVDYVAPDRWRIQPNEKMTELLIGNSVYLVQNGKTQKLPIPGGMLRKTIESFYSKPLPDDVKQSAKDLGMQTLNGQPVHVYSFTTRNVPVTFYVGPDNLPVQQIVNDQKVTTTITYSQYNEPIDISP